MMKKSLILFASVLAVLGIASCSKAYEHYEDPVPTRYLFTVHNSTDASIYFFVPDRAQEGATGELPATLTERLRENFYLVPSLSRGRLEINLDHDPCPIESYKADDEVTFYFFDQETFDTNEWETILAEKMWIGTCKLSAQQVIDMDCFIEYPDCMTEFN